MEKYKGGYVVQDASKYFTRNASGGYDETTKELLDEQEREAKDAAQPE